nr:MFS transporter [Candidatus Dormibacteraeota bacterium]
MAVKESPLARERVLAGGNLRWAMVFIAFLGTTINYVDRANLGVAVPFIQNELHISPSLVGLALGAFFITYATGQLPAGYFADRIGARIMYTIAVAWWSVFTAATAEWFPIRERAFATSIFDNGARFGTALSLPIVTAIIATLGWRASFVITGALGLGWAIAWFLFYRQPRQHPLLKKEELIYIEQGARAEDEKDRAAGPRIRWIDLFRYRTVLG